MIKLRLTGLPDELKRFAAWLADQSGIEVLETSARYPNRGDSQYHRQYVEIDTDADARQAGCKVLQDGGRRRRWWSTGWRSKPS